MFNRSNAILSLVAIALLLGGAVPLAVAADVDQAFEALAKYDWGQDRSVLKPIDDAVVASNKDPAAQKALQAKLAAVLTGDGSRAAKDYACRQLSLIGSADSVPALAGLLTDEKLSHMARYALERMPCDEAVAALRAALPKTKGLVQVGVINSLGVRRDAESTAALMALLGSSDTQTAAAAAAALGSIGTPEAAKALGEFRAKAPKELTLAAADASLTCAERLLADGKKDEAKAIYTALATGDVPKHVKVAAVRGRLAVVRAK